MEIAAAMETGIITRHPAFKFYLFVAKGAPYHANPSCTQSSLSPNLKLLVQFPHPLHNPPIL